MSLQQLQTMFPSIGQDTIAAVYQQSGNSLDQTIEALLAMNNTTSDVPLAACRPLSLPEVINKVMRMTSDPHANRLASKHGLNVTTVAWEDNGRTKGSCWGPCISDMTLNVNDNALPLIRHPNYEDLTW